MSLTHLAGGSPVHYPSNPNRFEFDAEVSRIFPDMAARSIPNFYESHAAHAAMLRRFIEGEDSVSVLDIGASRGAFFQALLNEYGQEEVRKRFNLTALDNSAPMCQYLREEFPFATVREFDITRDEIEGQFDVVVLHYVLQFLPVHMQYDALQIAIDLVKEGGVLIFGHKAAFEGTLGAEAHERYIQFRMKNGYTREEIEAKSKALKGAMHCMDHDEVLDYLGDFFSQVQETFRFMMFTTIMAVK